MCETMSGPLERPFKAGKVSINQVFFFLSFNRLWELLFPHGFDGSKQFMIYICALYETNKMDFWRSLVFDWVPRKKKKKKKI